MTIRNLTPHDIMIIKNGEVKTVYKKDGLIARAAQNTVKVGELDDGTPLFRTEFGEPVDLPAQQDGVLLIVSFPTVKSASKYGRDTSDLLLTINPVRNEAGQIIGCEGLSVY